MDINIYTESNYEFCICYGLLEIKMPMIHIFCG